MADHPTNDEESNGNNGNENKYRQKQIQEIHSESVSSLVNRQTRRKPYLACCQISDRQRNPRRDVNKLAERQGHRGELMPGSLSRVKHHHSLGLSFFETKERRLKGQTTDRDCR
jgi:hypothetical protein